MGLETVNSSSKPDSLNETWPVGTTDGTVFGAIHIRNIKTVMKNFYNEYLNFNKWFYTHHETTADGGPDPQMVKEAENADYLNNMQIADYHNIAYFEGDYPWSMIPRASLTEKGMTYVSHLTNSGVEDRAASAKAVKALANQLAAGEADSQNIGWVKVNVTAGGEYEMPLPSRLMGVLEAGHDVDIMIIRSVFDPDLPGTATKDGYEPGAVVGYTSYEIPLTAAHWAESTQDPDNAGKTSFVASSLVNVDKYGDHYVQWIVAQLDKGVTVGGNPQSVGAWRVKLVAMGNPFPYQIFKIHCGKIIKMYYRVAKAKGV